MQFNIDQDTGNVISGWVVPDNPSAVPKLRLSARGRPDIEISANLPRPDIRALGLHSTGMVGFGIDETIVPGLPALTDLALLETSSNVLLHRRFDGLPRKLLLLDISMTPEASSALLRQLGERFSLAYEAVERYPFDTLYAILNNQVTMSVYAAGRLSFVRYQHVLQANGYICAALLRHPFEDLALRLQVAWRIAHGDELASLYGTDLLPLVELVRTVDAGDLQHLKATLGGLSVEQAAAISNPLTKALACSIDEIPERRHVALALENLATMNITGSHARFALFRSSLSEMLGEDMLGSLSPTLDKTVTDVVAVLARIEFIRKLLRLDLALYSYIEDAFVLAEKQLDVTVEELGRSAT